MTEEEIKEMLISLANGDNWEYRILENVPGSYECKWSEWKPYGISMGIFESERYEYRKVEVWCVLSFNEPEFHYEIFPIDSVENLPNAKKEFTGTSKKECESWIKENTKTWLNKRKACLSVSFSKKELSLYAGAINEFAKELKRRVHKNSYYADSYGEPEVIKVDNLLEIIKEMGVEL